jgi:two-component system, cell cycle response regulator
VIARVSALKGNHELAYQKLESYYQNLQKIQQARTSGRLEKLKLELNQERERLEYAMLEKQSEVQRLTLNNQTRKIELQRFWLFGSISFIAVILSFLWWQLSASRQLKSLAITDELTGLTNRRYIFSAIERILHNKPGTHFHHSLMLIDLDDLKPINDGYGHQEGDRALKMVAKVGQKVSREGDIFARIGGDEFMLLLTRTDKKLETMVAQRIIETIARSPIKTRSGELLPISVSIGIVSIEDLSRSPEQVYNQVDQALYRAKSAGRNGFSR